MKYYKLLYDYEHDVDAICCDSGDLKGIDRYDVEHGKIIENWDSDITFTYDPSEGDRKTDYLGNNLGWLIISEKFRNVLQNVTTEKIQYLPVNIININNNQKLGNYFVVNIYNTVEALDLDKSEYKIFEIDENEKVISVKKYALKLENINKDIFKLKEKTIPIFLSERVMNEIKENNITGCDFLEVKVS